MNGTHQIFEKPYTKSFCLSICLNWDYCDVSHSERALQQRWTMYIFLCTLIQVTFSTKMSIFNYWFSNLSCFHQFFQNFRVYSSRYFSRTFFRFCIVYSAKRCLYQSFVVFKVNCQMTSCVYKERKQ